MDNAFFVVCVVFFCFVQCIEEFNKLLGDGCVKELDPWEATSDVHCEDRDEETRLSYNVNARYALRFSVVGRIQLVARRARSGGLNRSSR